MKVKKLYIISLVLFSLVLASCTSEELSEPGIGIQHGYSIEASIESFDTGSTRAIRQTSDDNWSYDKFENNQDVIGFYSEYGNASAPGGNGSFVNAPMRYKRMSDGNGYFENPDMDYDLNTFVEKTTFFYFPYHENIEYDPNHDYVGNDYGLELRVVDINDENKIEKCEDLLWVINPSNPTGSQRFAHAFSSLVIIRGEGFQNADNKTIKVVLNKGVSHVTLTQNDGYQRNAKLLYLPGYEKTEDECRDWYAWKGDKFTANEKDPLYPGVEFQEEAYYVLLPTTRGNDRLSVDHIELYDNDGNLKIVSDFKLYTSSSNASNSKLLFYGQRYPLLIKMQGLETVVETLGIDPWDEDVVISETREAGIGDASVFAEWARIYQDYLSSNRSSYYDDWLKKYGDKTEMTDGSSKWTFYILDDIDFSNYLSTIQSGNILYLLKKLEDTLDGGNFTVTGLNLESTASPTFIGELGAEGLIKDLNFKGLNIRMTDISGTAPVGGVFGVCGGSVTNCNIDGVVSGNGASGLLGGEGVGAVVSDCNFQGLVVGSSTSNKGIFGSDSGCTFDNVNTSGLIFQANN